MKLRPKSMYIRFSLFLSLFTIISIVLIGIFFWYKKNFEYQEINRIVRMHLQTSYKIIEENPLPNVLVDNFLESYIYNLLKVTPFAICLIVSMFLIIFHQIVGKHILRLRQINEETSFNDLKYYRQWEIPDNEVGDVILTRDQNIAMLEERLKDQENKLLQSSKLTTMGEMLSMLSHEINTPLNVIITQAELASLSIEESQDITLKSEVTQYLEKIEKTSYLISNIVKGLRSFSRDSSSDFFEPFSLKEIINETIGLSRFRAQNSNVHIESPEIKQDIVIECIGFQIIQVLLNLISNAFDAIKEYDEQWIKLRYSIAGDRIKFCVIDSGPGIPDDIFVQIQKSFVTSKKRGEGVGLGLVISRRIIDHHGGKLYLEKGINTCFCFEIPLKQKLCSKEHKVA